MFFSSPFVYVVFCAVCGWVWFHMCVWEKKYMILILPSRDAITWYQLIILPVPNCFLVLLWCFSNALKIHREFIFTKNNKGFQFKHKISFLFTVFNWSKRIANCEPGMKAYSSCTNITWLKHYIHDTNSKGVSGYVQYIKICEVFLDKLLCTIKLTCNANTLLILAITRHANMLLIFKTLVCMSGSISWPVNTALFKARLKCTNTLWASCHQHDINCKCKLLLLLGSTGSHWRNNKLKLEMGEPSVLVSVSDLF